jgi:hypothetical protein
MDDIKEVIRHAVVRAIRKGGNRRSTSRVIEDAAMEHIADDITAEVVDVMAIYQHNGGEA